MPSLFSRIGFVYANSSWLHDPELPINLLFLECFRKCANKVHEQLMGWSGRQSQHSNSRCLLRRKTERVCKIHIQCDENASLIHTVFRELLVIGTLKALLDDGRYVITITTESSLSSDTEILVQLKLHPLSRGTAT